MTLLDTSGNNPRQEALPKPIAAFEERHYTVAEIGALWNLSIDSVRKLFRNEPGVLAIGTIRARGKRQYLTLRIPASVLERVHRQKLLYNQYQKR
jgi:hypothetical protein